MKTLIVEDNPSAKRILNNLLDKHCPEIEIIGNATTAMTGNEMIKTCKPELLFLDIELPDGTAFDLLQNTTPLDFQVIFITAHEKYAVQAIKFSALDYLLKPIDIDELIIAVDKAKTALKQSGVAEKVKALLQNLDQRAKTPGKLVLHDKYGVQIIETEQIIRMESSGSYTTFFINAGRSVTISKGLKNYEKMLDPESFFRCHQSHLVNLNFLSRYDKKNGDLLILKDGSEVPLASRRRELLKERIKRI